jgi:hypothetical protein
MSSNADGDLFYPASAKVTRLGAIRETSHSGLYAPGSAGDETTANYRRDEADTLRMHMSEFPFDEELKYKLAKFLNPNLKVG